MTLDRVSDLLDELYPGNAEVKSLLRHWERRLRRQQKRRGSKGHVTAQQQQQQKQSRQPQQLPPPRVEERDSGYEEAEGSASTPTSGAAPLRGEPLRQALAARRHSKPLPLIHEPPSQQQQQPQEPEEISRQQRLAEEQRLADEAATAKKDKQRRLGKQRETPAGKQQQQQQQQQQAKGRVVLPPIQASSKEPQTAEKSRKADEKQARKEKKQQEEQQEEQQQQEADQALPSLPQLPPEPAAVAAADTKSPKHPSPRQLQQQQQQQHQQSRRSSTPKPETPVARVLSPVREEEKEATAATTATTAAATVTATATAAAATPSDEASSVQETPRKPDEKKDQQQRASAKEKVKKESPQRQTLKTPKKSASKKRQSESEKPEEPQQQPPAPPDSQRPLIRPISSSRFINERFELGKTMGDGNFAIVRACVKKESRNEYAMKVIDKSKLRGKEHMVINEVRIMKMCQHHNIVRLVEEYETRTEIYLVMELVKGGDLFDAISQVVKFNETQAAHMVADMANALFYLHSRNIVHRDLKPENLLVYRTKDNRISLKLGDFGLAMEVEKPIYTVCGTPTYVAPEILEERGYGLEVDLWALGVITYILLCGFPPFRSRERRQTELFQFIKSGVFEFLSPYWDHISLSAKDLIQRLLVVDRRRRYTAVDVLCHPWVISVGGSRKLPANVTMKEHQAKLREQLTKQADEGMAEFLKVKASSIYGGPVSAK
ncbi:hypothetical protein BOX15_Mlig029963g1 [Macrostomum lignano]|uniref:non-specific serine/threonine protein kinase n=1 Tax=Macrostomum lignano TaxID=282301 RepID=A0A267H2L5_9PLAT|nr:hypothetical protein BOX15_Mlig029963g1 [Macrostomum lignano]